MNTPSAGSATVAELLRTTTRTLFSFELLPPLKGHSIQEIYDAIDPLIEFAPSHINITSHPPETVYRQLPDGLLEKKVLRKRPGTVATAAAIQYRYGVTVVPHIICAGLNRDDTENLLIDFHFLGIHNLLLLRGDPPKGQRTFIAEPDGHPHTLGLVRQIMEMNRGRYLEAELKNTTPTRFSAGVAGYPEKHAESPNPEDDLHWLKEKLAAGAEYVVTQMFFDNRVYFDFVRRCREAGIQVPVVPGIKPVTHLSDLTLLPRIFSIDMPETLARELRKCSSNARAKELGVEWAVAQSKELVQAGVPVIHYYTIGISDNIRQIAKAVF